MFIPRTLSETGNGPNATIWRAVAVAAIVAAALFLILSANITLGQENLEAGQVAERDIRAPRGVTFDSESETEALRDTAAEAIGDVPETLKPPADNQADQLAAFDMLSRRVIRILDLRDRGTLAADSVAGRLATDVPAISMLHRDLVAEMSVPRWEVVAAAARSAIESTLAISIREDELVRVQNSVRDLITNDLGDDERDLAGDLAASLIEPNVVIDEQGTEELRAQARAEVPVVRVEVLPAETIVAEGNVDPRFKTTPYLHRIFVQAFFSTKGIQFHWLDYDAPKIFNSAYRIRSQLIFARAINSNYFGLGNAGNGHLAFPGATSSFESYTDYAEAQQRAVGGVA
ncbi:MAG: hypothetical protein ABIZ57_01915, partial [Candidatus Limnocylindria bacterium]